MGKGLEANASKLMIGGLAHVEQDWQECYAYERALLPMLDGLPRHLYYQGKLAQCCMSKFAHDKCQKFSVNAMRLEVKQNSRTSMDRNAEMGR